MEATTKFFSIDEDGVETQLEIDDGTITEDECIAYLEELKSLDLTPEQQTLIHICLDAVTAPEDADIGFGLLESVELGHLGDEYPEYKDKVSRCIIYLLEITDYEVNEEDLRLIDANYNDEEETIEYTQDDVNIIEKLSQMGVSSSNEVETKSE